MRKKKKKKIRRYNSKKPFKFKQKYKNSRNSRDYKNPEYKQWRHDVKTRDNYMCQWPGCCSRYRLEVHHIKTWAKYPSLRLSVTNGITLCNKCHRFIRGKEQDYETFFIKILQWQFIDKIKHIIKRKGLSLTV